LAKLTQINAAPPLSPINRIVREQPRERAMHDEQSRIWLSYSDQARSTIKQLATTYRRRGAAAVRLARAVCTKLCSTRPSRTPADDFT